MSENSIVTLRRRQALCEITSGKVASIPVITQIAFGSGGVNSSGEPIQPAKTATGLNAELARYNLDMDGGITYPIPTTARYKATIPAADLAGAEISEAALIDAGGGACAIKTFYVKRKDGGVTFTFTFDDEF